MKQLLKLMLFVVVEVLLFAVVARSSDEINLSLANAFRTLPQGSVGPLNPSFAGFSLEWGGIPGYFYPKVINSTLQFYANLRDASGGAPHLRVGGDSSDASW